MTPNLTNENRSQIGVFLLQHQKERHTDRGSRLLAASKFQCFVRTMSSLAKILRKQLDSGGAVNMNNKMKGKQSQQRTTLNKELVQHIPRARRTTQMAFAAAMNISTSIMHRWIKAGDFRSHSNAIKPQISYVYQLQRLHYSVCHLDHNTITEKTTFRDMHHIIQIDEKWFFITRVAERYYLLPEEDEPHRCTQNKRYIQKIMFLAAVCRPIIDNEGQVLFDGKIGIWPFSITKTSINDSKHRLAGTIQTVPEESVNKDVTKRFMLTKLVPAIKSKWPLLASTNILIRKDNARPHICDDDPEFRQLASSDGFNIRLGFQPPNSPDLNILDLGFFRAIQSLQHQTSSYTMDARIAATENTFYSLEASKLNKIFLTLQSCMVEMMKCEGSNRYKVPHIHKDALQRQGLLPMNLEVDTDLVRPTIPNCKKCNHGATPHYRSASPTMK